MGIQAIPTSSQEIAPKMIVEWIDGIPIYVMGNTDPTAIDKMYAYIISVMDNWSLERPYLAIYQMANSNVAFTQYARQQLGLISEYRPDLHGRTAVILMGGTASHAIRLFLMARSKQAVRTKKYFTNRTDALAWLRMIDTAK